MTLTRKQKLVKTICYAVLLIIADLLQNTSGLMPEIFTARCFIIIPSLIILAISEDEITAMVMGLLTGALWDASSAVHLGFNCIFLAVLCFAASALVNNLLRNTFITNMLICSIAVILYCITYWLCFIIIKGVDNAAVSIFSFYLPCAIYTIAISPVVYIVYAPVKKRLNK